MAFFFLSVRFHQVRHGFNFTSICIFPLFGAGAGAGVGWGRGVVVVILSKTNQ